MIESKRDGAASASSSSCSWSGWPLLTGVGYALLTGMMPRAGSKTTWRCARDWPSPPRNDSFDGQWPDGRPRIRTRSRRITRDERIMGAAACSPRGELLAQTDAYPHRVLLPIAARPACARGAGRAVVVDDAGAALGPRPRHRHHASRTGTSRSARWCWCTTCATSAIARRRTRNFLLIVVLRPRLRRRADHA